jgi:hypothetical protein
VADAEGLAQLALGRRALTGHRGATTDSRIDLLGDLLMAADDEVRGEGHGAAVVGRSGCLTN